MAEQKHLLILGASGGIGQQLVPILRQYYHVHPLSSRDCNVLHIEELEKLRADYVLSLVAVNKDGVIHDEQPIVFDPTMVNCIGSFYILNHFINHFRKENKPGKIILMSSYLTQKPAVGTGVYTASKAYIESIAKTAALENAHKGITINTIAAGYFAAGLTFKILEGKQQEILKKIPVRRFGEVQELAHAIRFILENDYVTGTNLVIDGGMSLT